MKHFALSVSLVFALALLLFAPASSQAVSLVDFGLYGTSSVVFNGTDLTGTLPVVSVTSPGTVLGALNFTTGVVTGTPTAGEIDFAPGGSFSIVGSFNGGPSGTTLLAGTLGMSTVRAFSTVTPITSQYNVMIGGFTATTIDPTFGGVYFNGVPPAVKGGFNIGFLLLAPQDLSVPFAFSKIAASGDFSGASVPLPPAALLFAPGLLGLVGLRKRFFG